MKKLLYSVLTTAVILVISSCFSSNVYGQSEADTSVQLTHSPKRATYLSLIPGVGQIYNKKYWKLPIVYVGFGVAGYFGFWNRGEYRKYNEAYICKLNNPDNQLIVTWDPVSNSYVTSVNNKIECDNELASKYTSEQLKSARDYYRRNMELSFIVMGLWYVLQILDATVDAHLYYWNVDENLSVRIEPVIMQPNITMPAAFPNTTVNHNGLKISVHF